MPPLPSTQDLQANVPQLQISLPLQVQPSLPLLAWAASKSPSPPLLMAARQAATEDVLDPAQLDSPHSRARLKAGGVEEAKEATPRSLKRAWEAGKDAEPTSDSR